MLAFSSSRRVLAVPLLIIAFVFAFGVSPAQAANINAASCSQANVQTAITQAADGDTVLVPAGSCIWTATVTIPNTKGITLQGAGVGQTIITQGSALATYLLYVRVAAPYFNRVTGFTFDLSGINFGYGSLGFEGAGNDAGYNLRVDHNTLTNIFRRGIAIFPTGSSVIYGVIDHNTLECNVLDANCQAITLQGPTGQSGMFAKPASLGSANSMFIESNTFNYTSRNDGCVEGYNGVRFVFRFNNVHTCMQGSHGADSSDGRGVMLWEDYNNTHDMQGCISAISCGFGMRHYRSGAAILFNNTWTAQYSAAINLDNYRSASFNTAPYLGWCSGSNIVDGNDYPFGRHCIDQMGALFTDRLDGSHTHVPLYVFNNKKAGVIVNAGVGNTSGAENAIVANRDFFNQAGSTNADGCTSAFNGTCGVGVGTRASRPSTCTGPDSQGSGGVGFWVTDEGEWDSTHSGPDGQMYRCTATNTWTLFYTPYVYPHPLTLGSGSTDTIPPVVTLNIQ